MTNLCWVRRALLVLALLSAVAGCGGPQTGDIQGKVTYRGKPVVYGAVVVFGQDQMPYYGTIQTDGTYTVKRVPVGPVRLGVNSPDPYFERPQSPEARAEADERQRRAGIEMPAKPPKGKWFRIPDKYADPRTANLPGALDGALTTIDIPLQ